MSNDMMFYLKQNGLNNIVESSDEEIVTEVHGYKYKIYLGVRCSKCGGPLMAIIDDNYNSTSCTNRFCKDYTI